MKGKILCTSSIITFAFSVYLEKSFYLQEQNEAIYLLTIFAQIAQLQRSNWN